MREITIYLKKQNFIQNCEELSVFKVVAELLNGCMGVCMCILLYIKKASKPNLVTYYCFLSSTVLKFDNS